MREFFGSFGDERHAHYIRPPLLTVLTLFTGEYDPGVKRRGTQAICRA
jgi:hypothetical protein